VGELHVVENYYHTLGRWEKHPSNLCRIGNAQENKPFFIPFLIQIENKFLFLLET